MLTGQKCKLCVYSYTEENKPSFQQKGKKKKKRHFGKMKNFCDKKGYQNIYDNFVLNRKIAFIHRDFMHLSKAVAI